MQLHVGLSRDHFQAYASETISEKVSASPACAFALLVAMRPLPGLCICDQLEVGYGLAGLCHCFSGCYETLLLFTTCASGLCHCPTSRPMPLTPFSNRLAPWWLVPLLACTTIISAKYAWQPMQVYETACKPVPSWCLELFVGTGSIAADFDGHWSRTRCSHGKPLASQTL